MLVFIIVSFIVFTAYAVLIFTYLKGWTSVPDFSVATVTLNERDKTTEPDISIIIPARNEAANIATLLDAIFKQGYPADKMQVIVIDDHSTDNTATIVQSYPSVTLLSLTEDRINSYKKKAVETGIAASTGELIICTDADCVPSPLWLKTITAFYQKESPAFIAAPVMIRPEGGLLALFQSMDFLVLQGITAASVHRKMHAMCNGANMAYRRSAFYEVNGFNEIDHIASGDDMLLMYKIRQKYPDAVRYLRSTDAIMFTGAQKGIRHFFSQRIRWASKATSYQEKNMLPVLALVYAFNLLFAMLVIAAFFIPTLWYLLVALWIAKTLVEFPFYYAVSGFYKMRWSAWLFFFFQPVHIIYTIVSGFLGQFRTYEWKGRKVS